MHLLGVDLGTSFVKAAIFEFTVEGALPALVAMSAVPVSLHTPSPGLAEQSPHAVLTAAREAIAQARARAADARGQAVRIDASGFSGAMHSLLPLDEDGSPCGPAITWADLRAAEDAATLRREGRAAELGERSGTPLHPMSPFCKLRWMRRTDAAAERRIHRFTGLKEFVLAALCGVPRDFMDRSMASATGLYNLQQHDWDEDLLGLAGARRAQMPRIIDGTSPLCQHAEFGIVVAGAGDGPLANLGCGAVTSDLAALTIGTSGAIRMCVEGPRGDAAGRTFCYALADGLWVVGGAISNGGVLLDWAARTWGFGTTAALLETASCAPVGADGLLLQGYLAGERTPHWDAEACGVLHGLRLHHGPEHIARAVVESTAFALRDVAQSLTALPARASATGGFTQSPLWLQTVADGTGLSLSVSAVAEAAALGAALLAARGAGIVTDLRAAAAPLAGAERSSCAPGAGQEVLAARFAAYRRLYAATRGIESGTSP